MRTTPTTKSSRPAAENAPSLLGRLRSQTPPRQLRLREALIVAERQAAALRLLTGTTEAYAFPLEELVDRARLSVQEIMGLPVSGLSRWSGRQWHVAIAAGDALVRQRFTVAHEFKHILDHPRRDDLSEGQVERVADHFAACLLMPKRLVVRLWGQGIQDLEALAEQFEVSTAALRYRLHQLRLLEPSRCRAGTLPVVQVARPWAGPSRTVPSAPGSRAWT